MISFENSRYFEREIIQKTSDACAFSRPYQWFHDPKASPGEDISPVHIFVGISLMIQKHNNASNIVMWCSLIFLVMSNASVAIITPHVS